MNTKAQGTIEYLVIVGIIIVISLIIVGLMIDISNQRTQVNDTSKNISNKLGTEGISVIEAISGFDGNGIIGLENIGGDQLRLTKISIDDVNNDYDNSLILGRVTIETEGLCVCEEEEKNKTCNFRFHFVTNDGLQKIFNQTITVTCNENFQPIQPPISPTPPILLDCFVITDNPIQICSLSDLNRVREKLDGNYILMNNINASDTRTWNSGAGFQPIGYSPRFSGNFNGNNKTISDLFIYSTESKYAVGLFGITRTGTISNLTLLDANVSSTYAYASGGVYYGYTGILTGWAEGTSTIVNIRTSGRVRGTISSGGIVGFNGGKVLNSSSTATIGSDSVYSDSLNCAFSSNSGGSGGIVAVNSGDINDSYYFGDVNVYRNYAYAGGITACNGLTGRIFNSYSRGTVSGTSSYLGGLVGGNSSSGKIYNSFSTATITGTGSYRGILIGYNNDGSTHVNGYYFASGGLDGIGGGWNNGWDYNCTATTPVDNFYSSGLGVYNGTPAWDFVNVWNTLNGTDYPTLKTN